jgi:hypothetical protein
MCGGNRVHLGTRDQASACASLSSVCDCVSPMCEYESMYCLLSSSCSFNIVTAQWRHSGWKKDCVWMCPSRVAHLSCHPSWASVNIAMQKGQDYGEAVHRMYCVRELGVMNRHLVECSHRVGSQWKHECVWWATVAVHDAACRHEQNTCHPLCAIMQLHLTMFTCMMIWVFGSCDSVRTAN